MPMHSLKPEEMVLIENMDNTKKESFDHEEAQEGTNEFNPDLAIIQTDRIQTAQNKEAVDFTYYPKSSTKGGSPLEGKGHHGARDLVSLNELPKTDSRRDRKNNSPRSVSFSPNRVVILFHKDED